LGRGCLAARARAVAATARGAIGRALRLVPTEAGVPGRLAEDRENSRELLRAALSSSAVPRFVAAAAQGPTGGRGGFSDTLEALADWLRDLLAVATTAEPACADPDERAFLERAVQQYAIHPLSVGAALDAVGQAQTLAQGNVNPQLLLSQLLRSLQRELRGAAAG
jgi:hypothetical protein